MLWRMVLGGLLGGLQPTTSATFTTSTTSPHPQKHIRSDVEINSMVIIGRQEYPSPFIFFELMKMVWVGEYRSSRGIGGCGGCGGSGGLKPTLQSNLHYIFTLSTFSTYLP